MTGKAPRVLLLLGLAMGGLGCHHPSVTAVSLNPHYCDHKFAFLYDPCKEPEGIPFYLPKPLLIIAKNFRNIEEAKVGLTDSAPIPGYFDDQAKYADLNARTNFVMPDGGVAQPSAGVAATSPASTFPTTNLGVVSAPHTFSTTGAPITPGASPTDGLKPDNFFTYHIVFVPDLTQKYGLKIKGGAGEIRAAMNLVNGWQFTGLGPYYMKDSSTAQNTLAGGITANLAASGVADVVRAVADLRKGAAPAGNVATPTGAKEPQLSADSEKVKALASAIRELQPKFVKIPGYAEISIYEPFLSPEGTMEWKLIAEKSFNRDVQQALDEKAVDQLLQSVAAPASNKLPDPHTLNRANDVPVPPPPPAQERSSPFVPPSPNSDTPVGAPPSLLPPVPGSPGSAPGASRRPTVQGPRVSTAPSGGSTRRSNGLATGVGKVDTEVVRTQATTPPAPTSIKLDQASITGGLGDNVTNVTSPTFDVDGVAANCTLQLLRGGGLVSLVPTGAGGMVKITDNGPLPNGVYHYTARVVDSAGRVSPLSPELSIAIGTEARAAATGVPAVDPKQQAFEQSVAQRFLSMPGMPELAPAPAAAAGASGASPTNQISLNQYFGREGGLAPKVAHEGRRLWPFHKEKQRPVSRQSQVLGLSPEELTALPASR
jgi:Bacterial Ig-like domain